MDQNDQATGISVKTADNKLIDRISILLLVYPAYFIFRYIYFFISLIGDKHTYSIGIDYFHLITVILMPVAIYFFRKREKAAWVLLTLYCTYLLTYLFIMLLIKFALGSMSLSKGNQVYYIIPALYFIVTLVLLCLRSVRNIFNIKKIIMYAITIGLPLLMILFYTWVFATSFELFPKGPY